MTRADLDKASYFLLSKYSSLYKSKYGKPANVNKYKEKWGMKSLVEDYGEDCVADILQYYFEKSNKDSHPLSWFFNNFDNLLDAKKSISRDQILRSQRRAEMEKIRREYLNGYA